MLDDIFIVSGREGLSFKPLHGRVVRLFKISSSTGQDQDAAVIELSPTLLFRLSLFRRIEIRLAVISPALAGVGMFPISEWPYPALLHRFRGEENEMLTSDSIEGSRLATLDKVLLCPSYESARSIDSE